MKKLFKIWGVVLTIMLIVGIMIPAAPAAALYGAQSFQSQPLPSTNGFTLAPSTNIAGIAMGPGIIYIVDNEAITSGTTGFGYKSTDGGASWTKLTQLTGAGLGVFLKGIAVAPDNANVVAVWSKTNAFVSSDGGSTWADLGTPGYITDLAIAPARSGTLLGREYYAAVADPAVTSVGNVFNLGNTATWTSVFGAAPGRDFVAVAVTANYLGDRSVVALSVAAAGGIPQLDVINTSQTTSVATPLLTVAGGTIDFIDTTPGATLAVTPAAGSILGGSIALPLDYDATTSSGRRAYVGFYSNGASIDQDVYRVDDNLARALSAGTVASLSYAGTVSSGTLFKGSPTAIDIKYSTDMTSGAPTWTSANKLQQPGAGAFPNVQVMVAPDYATSKKVMIGTSGAESAFMVSTNGGISFNQKSMIDMGAGVTNVNKMTGGPTPVTPDGKMLFMATVSASGNINVWTSTTPTSDSSWQRVYCAVPTAAATTASMTMPGDYATTSTIYMIEYTGTSAKNLWRSADAGQTWNSRVPPSGGSYRTYSAQDSNILYWADASANIFKSTNGGFTWSTAVATGLTDPIITIQIPKADNLIIGATGNLGTSNDGGTTFTKIDLDAGVGYRIARDPGFATNNILYLADSTGSTGLTYKFILGTDTKATNMITPNGNANVSGVASIFIKSGVMYVIYSGIWGASPFTASGWAGARIDRSVNFQDTPGTINWSTLDTGVTNAPLAGVTGGSYTGTSATDKDTIIYIRYGLTGTPALYAYDDMVGTVKPVVTAPKNNANINVDPNTGYAQQVTLVLNAMGSGNGLVTQYQVQLTDNASGWPGAQLAPGVGVGIVVNNPTQPTIVIGNAVNFPNTMQANTAYMVRVRAFQEVSGDMIDSPWSDPINLNIQSGGQVVGTQVGPVLTGPVGGATNVSTTPGFAWAPVFGATSYKFTLATDAAMTKTVGGTPVTVTLPSFQPATALTEGTTYFWSVQAIAPTAGPVSVGTFMTAPKAVAGGPGGAPATITIPPFVIPTPVFTIPAAPAPVITVPAAPPAPAPPTPAYVWAIIIIGAVLVIAVIVLILRTRKTV